MSDPNPKGPASWRGSAAGGAKKGDDRQSKLVGLLLALGLLGAAIVALVLLFWGESVKSTLVTVTVGDYGPLFPDIKFAHRDYDSLRQHLGSKGHYEIDSDQKKIETLVDFKYWADRLAEVPNSAGAKKRDVPVVIYFSSLAVCRSTGGKPAVYLIPGDARPGDLADANKLFPLRELLGAFKKNPQKEKILALDIMLPLADPRLGVLADDVAAGCESEIAAMGDLGGVVITACSAGETSHVSEDLGRTVFGYYLEEGLRGYADGFADPSKRVGKGGVTAAGLANFVEERVARWAMRNRVRSQTPRVFQRDAQWLVADVKGRALGHVVADPSNLRVDVQQPPAAPTAADGKADAAPKPAEKPKPPEFNEPFIAAIGEEYWGLCGKIEAAAVGMPMAGTAIRLLRRAECAALVAERKIRADPNHTNLRAPTHLGDILEDFHSASTGAVAAPGATPSLGLAYAMAVRPAAPSAADAKWQAKWKEAFDEAQKIDEKKDFKAKDEDANKAFDKLREELAAVQDRNALARAAIDAAIGSTEAKTGRWLLARKVLKEFAGNVRTRETAWLERAVHWAEEGNGWQADDVQRVLSVVIRAERLLDEPAAFHWLEAERARVAESVHRTEVLALSIGHVTAAELRAQLAEAKTQLDDAELKRQAVLAAYAQTDAALKMLPRYWYYVDRLANGVDAAKFVERWSNAVAVAAKVSEALARGPIDGSAADGLVLARELPDRLKRLAFDFELEVDKILERSLGDRPREDATGDPADFERLDSMLATPLGSFADRQKWYGAARRIAARTNKSTILADHADDEQTDPPREKPKTSGGMGAARVAEARVKALNDLLTLGGEGDGQKIVWQNDASAAGDEVRSRFARIHKSLATPAKGDVQVNAVERLSWIRLADLETDRALVDPNGYRAAAAPPARSWLESPIRQRGLQLGIAWEIARFQRTLSEPAALLDGREGDWGNRSAVEALLGQMDAASSATIGALRAIAEIKQNAEIPTLAGDMTEWKDTTLTATNTSAQGGAPTLSILGANYRPFRAEVLGIDRVGEKSSRMRIGVSRPDIVDQKIAKSNVVDGEARGFLARALVGDGAFHQRVEVKLERGIVFYLAADRDGRSAIGKIVANQLGKDQPTRLYAMLRNETTRPQKCEVELLDGSRPLLRSTGIDLPPGETRSVPLQPTTELKTLEGSLAVAIRSETKTQKLEYPIEFAPVERIADREIVPEVIEKEFIENGTARLFDLKVTVSRAQKAGPKANVSMEIAGEQKLLARPLATNKRVERATVSAGGSATMLLGDLRPINGGEGYLFVHVDGVRMRRVFYLTGKSQSLTVDNWTQSLLWLKVAAIGAANQRLVADREEKLLVRAEPGKPVEIELVPQSYRSRELIRIRTLDDDLRPLSDEPPAPAVATVLQGQIDQDGAVLIAGSQAERVLKRTLDPGTYRFEASYEKSTAKIMRTVVVDDSKPELGTVEFVASDAVGVGDEIILKVRAVDKESGVEAVYFYEDEPPKEDAKPSEDAPKALGDSSGMFEMRKKLTKPGKNKFYAVCFNRLGMQSRRERELQVADGTMSATKKLSEAKATAPRNIKGRVVVVRPNGELRDRVSGIEIALKRPSEKNKDVLETYKTATSDIGGFRIEDVKPGTYSLEAKVRDTKLFVRKEIEVKSGEGDQDVEELRLTEVK